MWFCIDLNGPMWFYTNLLALRSYARYVLVGFCTRRAVEKYRTNTTLANRIWQSKNKIKQFKIRWSLIDRGNHNKIQSRFEGEQAHIVHSCVRRTNSYKITYEHSKPYISQLSSGLYLHFPNTVSLVFQYSLFLQYLLISLYSSFSL